MNEQKMREEFNKWWKNGGHRTNECTGIYGGIVWDAAWQAALSTKQQAGEPVGTLTLLKDHGLSATVLLERRATVKNGDNLYTAPQLPRDVLMRVAEAVQEACAVACIESNGAVPAINLATIVDAALPGVEQPEPMNQQMLAALKRYDIEVEGGQIYRVGSPDGRYVLFDDVAAAESAQAQQTQAVGVPDGWREELANCVGPINIAIATIGMHSAVSSASAASDQCERALAWINSMLATATDSVPRLPDGWQMVPVEPDPSMIDAAQRLTGIYSEELRQAYKAMLAAAPKPEGETCESGLHECGPVAHHDIEGVPLCDECWKALIDESAAPKPEGGE